MSRFITLLAALFAATAVHAATTTFSDPGDPMLRFSTDLPRDNPLVVKIAFGVKAVREYLKYKGPQEIDIYNPPELFAASKKTEQQWGSKWAITAGTTSYFNAARVTQELAVRISAREVAIGYFNTLLGRSFGGPETSVPFDGPYLFMEGGGDYVVCQALKVCPKRPTSPQPLDKLEKWQDFSAVNKTRDAYADAFWAVELLVSLTSFDKLKEYWRERGKQSQESWRVTFERVFMRSVEDFYASSDRYMRRGA